MKGYSLRRRQCSFRRFDRPFSSGITGSWIARMDAMRLVAGALALTLFASFARAEGTASPGPARSPGSAYSKIPLRVVRVMPESHQALLFDRSRSTHVLVEVGGKVDGYTVEDIDDDEVTLRFRGKQIVLAAPARASERRVDRRPPGPTDAGPTGAGPTDAGDRAPSATAWTPRPSGWPAAPPGHAAGGRSPCWRPAVRS